MAITNNYWFKFQKKISNDKLFEMLFREKSLNYFRKLIDENVCKIVKAGS